MEDIELYEWDTIIIEGRAKVIVPRQEFFLRSNGIYEPAWAPVFYNPVMEHNRSVTVLLLTALFNEGEFFFIEPLAGTGVRSIRIALEAGGVGIANDLEPLSYRYITRNIALNGLRNIIEAYNCDANSLMNSIRNSGVVVDFIDLDPYGSPMPFIEEAAHSIGRGGVIAVTATDTATLNCNHPEACLRKYGAWCKRVDFSKEMGLRILVGSIIRASAAKDVALKPLIAYYKDYYYRAFFRADKSAGRADELLKNIGYIKYDKNTLSREYLTNSEIERVCEKHLIIGPLWISELIDAGIIERALTSISERRLPIDERIVDFLRELLIEYEINTPYYRLDKLCKVAEVNMPQRSRIVEALKELGYKASVTHFDSRGIRTNAPLNEILSTLKKISAQ
ncbi:MAG: tRNA (guanine(10)-N(2))-dimethyltransferase [Desulfurococcaceae archaeon]